MKRLTLVILILISFAFAGLPKAESVDAAKAKVEKAMNLENIKVIEVPVEASKNATRIWWNDSEVVKALSLTDEQQKKMGELQKIFIKKVPANRRLEKFHETLVQGDWTNAQSESAKIVERAAESVRLRGALKIDVLSLLSKTQRQKLVDKYPRLIYKPWRRAMRDDSKR